MRDLFNDFCPPWAKPYARLMRLDKPIGTWLLLLPCWWGGALASNKFPNLWLMLLFAVGAIIMRGAGCVINDIYDRNLDRQVERTRTRPLASGELKLWQAILLLIALLLIGFGILLLFNRTTIIIGAVSLLLVFTYPLMKRITWWPQLFLGFTFNWGALLGWSSVTENIRMPALLLYIAGISWTLAYDTIYAHQDKRDDAMVGIKSTARLFDQDSKKWVSGFFTLTILFLLLAGYATNMGISYYVVLTVAGAFAATQVVLWKMDDPDDCRWRFEGNRNFGLIVLLGIVLGKFL